MYTAFSTDLTAITNRIAKNDFVTPSQWHIFVDNIKSLEIINTRDQFRWSIGFWTHYKPIIACIITFLNDDKIIIDLDYKTINRPELLNKYINI